MLLSDMMMLVLTDTNDEKVIIPVDRICKVSIRRDSCSLSSARVGSWIQYEQVRGILATEAVKEFPETIAEMLADKPCP